MADTQREDLPPPEAITTGTIISQRYELVELVGRGAYGEVWKAADLLNLYRPVAIKILRTEVLHPETRRRFQDECSALELLLPNDHIVKILGRGSCAGRDYVITEYLRGLTLSQWLYEVSQPTPYRWAQALEVFVQICEALAAAHRLTLPGPIIHCDIKPENIIVTQDGGKLRATLLDFGVALLGVQGRSAGGSGYTPGTPTYMAPEQLLGEPSAIGPWTDVFALGVLLVEILTLRPYGPNGEYLRTIGSQGHRELGAYWHRVHPDVDSRLWPILLKSIAPRVEERYPDAGALLAAMRQVALHPPPHSETVEEPCTFIAPLQRANYNVFIPLWRRLVRWGVCVMSLLGVSDGALSIHPQPGYRHSVPPDMAFIPGGRFQIGSTPVNVDQVFSECLSEQTACRTHPECTTDVGCIRDMFNRQLGSQSVELSSFYLDRVEVSNARYAEWLNSLSLTPGLLKITYERWVWYEGWVQLLDLSGTDSGIAYKNGRFVAQAGREQLPVVRLTWDGAERFCAAHGKTLPSEAQWEWAARGPEDRKYPWGDGWTTADCPSIALARAIGLSCGHLSGLAPVGQSVGDRTPEGVLDLGGNVMEWMRDGFRHSYAVASIVNPHASSDSEIDYRSVRGGAFNNMTVFSRSKDRSRWERNRGADNIGFRCSLISQ